MVEKTLVPNYISRKKAAEMFDTSLATIDRWCSQGIITRYKIGGQTRLLVDEILKAIKPVPDKRQKVD